MKALASGMALALLAAGLAGCGSVGGISGAATGIATGSVTGNPAVGVAVGVATRAAVDDAMDRIYREMQNGEQDRIAMLAGELPKGERRPWTFHHGLPRLSEGGELEVVGESTNALTTCREVLFSVVVEKKDQRAEQWFVTQTCLQPDGRWRWAAAEPATRRWGVLQ